MKIKSLLVGMLACTAMVSCTNEEVLEDNNVVNNGNVKESYIAVGLNYATAGSRATEDPTFAAGSTDENAVKDITFFFFDVNGAAYAVDGTENFLVKDYTEGTVNKGDVNIEEISAPVLLIEESKNVPPQKVLAVLNAPEALKKTMSLTALQAEVGAYNTITEGQKTYFVMSNSVYKNAASGAEVVATDITAANVCSSAEKANANPVQIYVERVAAKVAVTASNFDVEDVKSYDTGITTADGTAIYAKVIGWQITNVKSQAQLLKKIDAQSWTDANLGFAWNDAANFRSYWANTASTGECTHPHNWAALTDEAARYYYENTGETKSQLLVAATFVNADGTDINEEIAEWYGAKYTLSGLKTNIANAVASQIYVKSDDGKSATSITSDYITFYQEDQDAPEKRYLCYATLDEEAAEGKTFVKADGETEMKVAEINAILNAIQPAKIWFKGGYYFLNVQHLGEEGTPAEYGIVRNHVYDVTIKNIDGLGTPVYDPTKIIIPEKPQDDASSIAAQINVLSWKIVKNEVALN